MGLLADAFSRKSAASFDILRDLLGRRTSSSGKVVNIQTALEVAAVFACVRVISEGIAQVPFKLMKRSTDGSVNKPAVDHPLYDILASQPNDWQTSFEYRETIAMHAVLCGAHYSFKNVLSDGRLGELIPFDPGQVRPVRNDDWSITYHVRGKNGEEKPFPQQAIWHVKGPSWNSWMGLESVQIAREAIGLSIALEEQQSRMQKSGVRTSGTYSVEGALKDDQYKSLRKWIDEEHAGAENTGKAMILDRGAKWLNTTMTGIDAQQLETRKHQVEEVCRYFRVMPIMVGAESKNTTYASAEQMFLAHVVHCLSPWYQRLEQSADVNLVGKKDRAAGYYTSFIDEGLLRGSSKDKADVILRYVNGGIMYPNEGRRLLDLNPDADPKSNQLRVPTNIVGANSTGDTVAKAALAAALKEGIRVNMSRPPAYEFETDAAGKTTARAIEEEQGE